MGLILGSSNGVIKGLQITGFTQGVFVTGPRNIIGGDRSRGTGPTGEGNVISGNASVGVDFAKDSASENRLIGNLIGTDATGTRPLGVQRNGIMVFPGGPGNVIGGEKPGEGNVISGNGTPTRGANGIGMWGTNCFGNVIIGNYIGVNASANLVVVNYGAGVDVQYGCRSNSSGGANPSAVKCAYSAQHPNRTRP